MADDLATIGYKADLTGINQINKGLNSVGTTSTKTADKMTASMGKVGRSAGQAGIQVQQFVGQVQMGTSPMVALSQQAADLGIVLGAPLLGAITGITASIAAAFLPALFDSTTEAERLTETLESLDNVVTQNSAGVPVLSSEIARLAKVSESAANAQIALSVTEAKEALILAREAASEAVTELDDFFNGFDTTATSTTIENLDSTLSRTGKTVDELLNSTNLYGTGLTQLKSFSDSLNESLGLTTSESVQLIRAVSEFNSGGSITDLAQSFTSISENSDNSSKTLQSLVVDLNKLSLQSENSEATLELLKGALGDLDNILESSDTAANKLVETYNNKTAALSANSMEMEIAVALQAIGVDATEEETRAVIESIEKYHEKVDAVKAEIEQQKLAEAARKKEIAQLEAQQKAYDKWIESIEYTVDPTKSVREEIEKLNTAMDNGDLSIEVGTKRIEQLEEQLNSTAEAAKTLNSVLTDDEYDIYAAYSAYGAAMVEAQDSVATVTETAQASQSPYDSFINGSSEALSAIQNLTESGTSEYENLTLAIQAAATAQALLSGNYLGAFASATSLLSSVSGDLETTFEEAQEEQGLNEWNEKASSIDDSVSSMESNTEKLVGINTDMLDALTTLQDDLLAAAGIVVRDTDTPTINTSGLISSNPVEDIFSAFGSIGSFTYDFFDTFTFGLFSGLGSILGGSSSVSDEGIKILGGTLEDLMDDTVVKAFQSVSYKEWAFGSTKSKTSYSTLSDSVSSQFEAVFTSLADSVYAGATALGYDSDEITDAINSFVVDTITISLKDLSTDEQVEALEDVFSQVFNELTEAVIPWLDELQDVGEDLGETLSRVATEVAIANLLIDQLGVSFGDLTTQEFAYAADNISDLVGGVDELSSALSSFLSAFASDETMLEIYSDALSESLEAIGLSLPTSADGFWDLASSIDASTEEGQEQIATILSLTDTASEYYDLLESTDETLNDLSDTFVDTIMDIYDLSDAASEMSLDAALAAARLGDFSLAEALDSSDYELDTSDYSTKAAYDIAQAEAANKLLEIAELAANETSVEEEQLSVLMQINENIVAGYNPMIGTNTMTDELSAQSDTMNQMKELSAAAVKINAKMSSNIDRIVRVGIPTYED